MLESASKKSIACLSITEHISQIQSVRHLVNFHSTHRTGRIYPNLDSLLLEYDSVRDRNYGMRVKRGLEVDYIAAYEKEISEPVGSASWDIILRSVHEFKKGDDIETSFRKRDAAACEQRWKEYVTNQIELVESTTFHFDVLTHPVRLAVGTPQAPQNLVEVLVPLAEKCKSNQVAIELNGRDMQTYIEIVQKLAEACKIVGCPVSFGSDAHHPNEICRGIEPAQKLADIHKLTFSL
jgi:HisJ family histidinol phosphate phosphatase